MLDNQESPSKELLPCPFCQGEPYFTTTSRIGNQWDLCCAKCSISLQGFETKEKAIEFWDTRKGDAAFSWLSKVQLRNRQLPATQQTLDSAEKKLKEKQDDLNFIWKWIERASWDKHTSPETAISIIKHYDHAPWYKDRDKWDTSHKDYDAKITEFVEDKEKLKIVQQALEAAKIGAKENQAWAENAIADYKVIKEKLDIANEQLQSYRDDRVCLGRELERSKKELDSAVEALTECTEDLKSELDARYYINDGDIHPAMKDRYKRDMSSVYKAQAALANIEKK